MSDSHFETASLCQLQGKHEKAIQHFELAIENGDNLAPSYYSLGELHLKNDNLTTAQSMFENALAVQSDLSEAHRGLGDVFFAQKNFNQSAIAYRAALHSNPNSYTSHFSLGRVLFEMDQYLEAEQSFLSAFRLNPEDPAPLLQIGHLKIESNDFKEAECRFRQVLGIDESCTEAHIGLCRMLIQADRIDDASIAVTEALSKGSNLPESYLQEGIVHFKQGRWYDAERAFRMALETLPEMYDGRVHLIRTLSAQSRWSEVRDECCDLLQRFPENDELHQLLRESRVQLGDPAAAVDTREIYTRKRSTTNWYS